MYRRPVWLGLALAACSGAPELASDSAEPGRPSSAAPALDAAPLPDRRFLLVEGAVKLDGRPAAVGLGIGPQATIVVAPRARAVISLGPGSFVELRSGSRVRLASSRRKRVSLQLLAGAAWSFIAPGSSYEVVTTNAVAGVRGGTFFVEAQRGQSYVCDCDGDLQLQVGGARALPRNVASIAEHVGAVIRGRGSRAKMTAVKRRGHTQEEEAGLGEVAAGGP